MDEIPLDPYLFGQEQPCFGCSPTHPIGFHLQFHRRGDEVVTRFTPGAQYQGPPGIMHGGLLTTLADEIAAWTIVTMKGRFGFTAELQARLARPVRIGLEVEGVGRIEKDGARIVKTVVELHQAGLLCFRGGFTFALLDETAAQRMLGGPLPEAWKKFAR
jgi:acyl-coenzyme A thioesterase PaaI-like protein